jgi:hypothetical protein
MAIHDTRDSAGARAMDLLNFIGFEPLPDAVSRTSKGKGQRQAGVQQGSAQAPNRVSRFPSIVGVPEQALSRDLFVADIRIRGRPAGSGHYFLLKKCSLERSAIRLKHTLSL